MKAVIPAAGYGTRLLPATKAQPKEMLPVVDKPAIQYVVEEAVSSGANDLLIITGRGKRAIEDHFDRAVELEYFLKEEQKHEFLDEVRTIADLAEIHYIRQKELEGLGKAIMCAEDHVGNQPFAVLLGDTITMTEIPCTKQLADLYNKKNASIVAVERVPREKVERYGIVAGHQVDGGIFKVEDLIEKPSREEAPSDLALFGRYYLTPQIFECLKKTAPDKRGEIQLTDALKLLLEEQEIYAFEIIGKRYDIGSKLDWLKANVEIALDRPDLKDSFSQYIATISQQL